MKQVPNPKSDGSGELGASKLVVLGILTLIVGGAAGFWYWQKTRDQLPELAFPEVDQQQNAANVVKLEGPPGSHWVQSPQPIGSPVPQNRALTEKEGIPLGSWLSVGKDSRITLQTPGLFFMSLEKGGEFLLQDARTDASRSRHTLIWTMKSGLMRFKSFEGDSISMLRVKAVLGLCGAQAFSSLRAASASSCH